MPGGIKTEKRLCRWKRAIRSVILRRRAGLNLYYDLGRSFHVERGGAHVIGLATYAAVRTSGPQLHILYTMHPPTAYPGNPNYQPPAPAELQVEVCCAPGSSLPPLPSLIRCVEDLYMYMYLFDIRILARVCCLAPLGVMRH